MDLKRLRRRSLMIFKFQPIVPCSVPEYRDPTKRPGQGQNVVKCDYGQQRPPGKVCDVDLARFGPCKKENTYSYNKGTPCIFLKLNKVGKRCSVRLGLKYPGDSMELSRPLVWHTDHSLHLGFETLDNHNSWYKVLGYDSVLY